MFHWVEAFFATYQEPDIIRVYSDANWQTQMLTLHNVQRGNRRMMLKINPKLQAAAQKHADWMAQTGIMSHTGKNRSTMQSRIQAEGYRWYALGENVAYGYPTIQAVVKGWMDSYGHRMNILNPNFTEVGFGKATDKNGLTFWCTDFGKS